MRRSASLYAQFVKNPDTSWPTLGYSWRVRLIFDKFSLNGIPVPPDFARQAPAAAPWCKNFRLFRGYNGQSQPKNATVARTGHEPICTAAVKPLRAEHGTIYTGNRRCPPTRSQT